MQDGKDSHEPGYFPFSKGQQWGGGVSCSQANFEEQFGYEHAILSFVGLFFAWGSLR